MKKAYLLLIAIMFIANCYSQNVKQKIELPATVEVFLPKSLMQRPLPEKNIQDIAKNNYGQSEKVVEKKFWNVFSDRRDNIAYLEPNISSETNCKLGFNQELRIAKIKNGFALVYKYKNNKEEQAISYPGISQDSKAEGALGWVPMDKLLLWSSCPADQHGILKKALIVQNLNKSIKKENLGKLYWNPDLLGQYGDLTSNMTFYYVFKKCTVNGSNLVLLSSEGNVEGTGLKKPVLLGWVEESSYTPWNQRSCLEYNWDDRVIDGHLKDRVVKFYKDYSLSTEISKGYKFDAKKEKGSYRIPGSRLRMPILDYKGEDSDKVYKCTFFASADGKMSQNEAEIYAAEMREKHANLIKNKNKLNMIVVIDGTQSMNAYFDSLHSAIKRGWQGVSSEVDFNVGLVIYRDFADGPHVADYIPVTKIDDPRLKDYMTTGGPYKIRSAPGDDYPEALYYGLNIALDTLKMKYKKEESNLVVVIGDCGNHIDGEKVAKAPTEEQLLEKLKQNNASLVSFQVHHKSVNEFWDLFSIQMNNLVNKNAEDNFMRLAKNNTGKFNPTQNNDGFDFKVAEGGQLFVASTRTPKNNSSMKPDILSNLIKNSIKEFDAAVDEQKAIIHTGFNARTEDEMDKGDQFSQAYLESQFGKEGYETLKRTKTLCALNGFTPKKTDSNQDYYKSVIFISIFEFQQMMEYFGKVYAAARNIQNRAPYIDAMKQLLRTMVPDMTPEQMKQMGNKEITNMIAGLNATTDAQKGYTLEQIGDKLQVNDAEFKKLIANFNTKYRELERIQEEGYNYTFNSNNDIYYWLPIELLP